MPHPAASADVTPTTNISGFTKPWSHFDRLLAIPRAVAHAEPSVVGLALHQSDVVEHPPRATGDRERVAGALDDLPRSVDLVVPEEPDGVDAAVRTGGGKKRSKAPNLSKIYETGAAEGARVLGDATTGSDGMLEVGQTLIWAGLSVCGHKPRPSSSRSSSIILSLKASRSAGLRLVIQLSSTTTGSSWT